MAFSVEEQQPTADGAGLWLNVAGYSKTVAGRFELVLPRIKTLSLSVMVPPVMWW
jgi:hypothetical protein